MRSTHEFKENWATTKSNESTLYGQEFYSICVYNKDYNVTFIYYMIYNYWNLKKKCVYCKELNNYIKKKYFVIL